MLPEELLDELDQVVGRGQRSEFIVESVAEALRKRRLIKALRAVAQETDKPDIPEWEDSDGWVREGRKDLRDEWAQSPGDGE
jgi:Arc/MetJ-type ribon-helix-helix transcriptional regulator